MRGGHNGVNGRARAWTHEAALEAGRLWVERFGQPPTRSELNPAILRAQLRRTETRLAWLEERVERFDPAEMPGQEVVARLFGGMDAYLHALGFEPRGTGRPRLSLASVHRAQARALVELRAGHRQVLAALTSAVQATDTELAYQRRRRESDLGPVQADLDELEAAGLVEREVRVSYRLTDAGRAAASEEQTAA